MGTIDIQDLAVADIERIPPGWRSEIPLARTIGTHLCGLQRFMFSTGLLVDLTFDGAMFYGYTARYCYEETHEAIAALLSWDGEGDPPGPWIKEKMSERLGPGASK